jgi:PPOX class probable F420-dependent enzyme
MVSVPESHLDILNKASLANVATVDANGMPQVTPVWIDYVDGYFLMNSARGRKKDRNLRQRGQVALSIVDKDNLYRYIGVQGCVVEISEEGAEAHIHKLSYKYRGRPYDALPAGQVRVIYKIEPQRIWTMG